MNTFFPDSVIFDLDGTLIDSAEDVRAALNQVLGADGYAPLSSDVAKSTIGEGMVAMIDKVMSIAGYTKSGNGADEFARRYLAAYALEPVTRTKIYPGAVEVLDEIKGHGTAMGICTNKPGTSSRQILAALGLDHYFQAVVTPDECDHRKPDARHIRQTLQMMGSPSGTCIMVGDSASDITAANNAGIYSVVVSFGYSRSPVSELGADRVIDGFEHLIAAMRDICRTGKTA